VAGVKPRLSRAFILFATGLGATVALAALSKKVKGHETASFDGRARRRFPKRRRKLTKQLATLVGPMGKEWIHGPIAAVVGLHLWREGRRGAAATILASSAVSAGLSHLFDATITPRKAPPGRHSRKVRSFPSGHSLETSAVSLTIAYVLVREGMADGRIALPAALTVPVLSGLGRLYLDRHWTTDVLAGWLAGTAVAAASAAAYEATAG
jgi:undecaprenyl-diphosphatase